FGLSPALPGCSGSKNCHFAWSGNTLTFIHAHVNFDVSTAYQVSMHAGYADATGQQNGLEHSWRFVTEGRPALVAVDPSDNATAVAPDRNIVLSFSRPMLADSMRAAVQLSPDAPFLLRSKPGGDGAQFEIIPAAVLQPNQSYTLSVDRPVDTHENAIYGRVQTRFRTGSLGLSRKIGYLVAQHGTIVYRRDGTLRRFRPSTLEDIALTDLSDGRVNDPVALSPDGKSIAYSAADAQGVNHLWILNLDLRSRYRPVGLDDPADHPAWSPNGTKLAFRRLTAAGPELWVYDLSASGAGAYRHGGPLDVTGAAWLNDNSTVFVATGSVDS